MKKNNKGFAISGVIYPLLIIVTFFTVQILFMLNNRKVVLDDINTELVEQVDANNKVYTNEELSILVNEMEKELDETKAQLSSANNQISQMTNNWNGISTTMLNKIYPVGSVYLSANNVSPQTFLGGTWIRSGAGRTIVGVDESQSSFNSSLKTGGSATHTHSSGTIVANIGAFDNDVGAIGYAAANKTGVTYTYGIRSTSIVSNISSSRVNHATTTSGNTSSSSSYAPYITYYIWRRTA